MKDKFKQTSIFSTFKRKLDNIKWRRGSREEPVLLGIKSTRTNCEVSDDFEYIDSRRKDSDIYCSVNSLYCSTQRETLQETSQVPKKNKLSRKKKKENEIEIFERKFLSPLSSQVSSTRILITHGSETPVSVSPAPVMSSVRGPASSGSSVAHVRVLRTSSKDSDCDSGAYSRSSSPEPIYERLDRSCEKLDEKFTLQSPNLVLSVIKENYKAKVNSNLLLSCLNEAGKSSIFCSLDSLNQFTTQPRHFKKNPALRKLWSDPPISSDVTVGSHSGLSNGFTCSKSETDLNKISDVNESFKLIQRSHKNHQKKHISVTKEHPSIKICDCQVTVNGQHICNLII